MMDSPAIRVLNDLPLDGPTNMARDEALLVRVGMLESPPTLRLYQWDPPTISLGYFQPYADYEALPPPAGRLAVVRRTTGGGAILHDLELTYSLTLPADHVLLSSGVSRLYELAHDAVMASLESLGANVNRCGETDDSGAARGPFFCFQRRHCYDVLLDDGTRAANAYPSPKRKRGVCQPVACALGSDPSRTIIRGNPNQKKIVGSAQRRTPKATLQHGSIILDNRYEQQSTATVPVPFEKALQRMRSDLVIQLARQTDQAFKPGIWSPGELSHAETLTPKYAGDEWTRRT